MLAIVWEFWQWGKGELIPFAIFGGILLALALFIFIGTLLDGEFGFDAATIGAITAFLVASLVLFFCFALGNESRLARQDKQAELAEYFESEFDLDVVRVDLNQHPDEIFLRSSCGNEYGYELTYNEGQEKYEITTKRIWLTKRATSTEQRGAFVDTSDAECPLPHEEADMPG